MTSGVGACDRILELDDRDSVRPCDIRGAVVADKIGNLDSTNPQPLLVLLVETLKCDRCKVGRRRQKLKSGASSPSFMKSMACL